MDSMEINKAFGAILTAGIAFMGASLLGGVLVHPTKLDKPAILIEGAAPAAGAPAAEDPPIAALLVSADPARGEAATQKAGCVACHSFNEGGKAGVGPNLYGVVGGPHGHMEGYAYSTALKSKAGPWTYDELNEWLKKPSAYAPGTKMTYAGMADPKTRADIIDYLHSLSHTPVPFPPPPPEGAKAAAATPAAGAAPAGDQPIAVLLAKADPDAGKAQVSKSGCVACHSFNDGGKAGVGPNLYGVVGGPHAHMVGFAYSDALKSKAGPWTFDELNEWLKKPAAYAPGTKMTFAGLPDAQARANVIDYLRTLAANPEPLPSP